MKFRDMAKEIASAKETMSEECAGAFFSITAAEYAAGAFKGKVLEGNFTASVRVSASVDNVAGVKLPVFQSMETGHDGREALGLASGGKKIDACRDKFTQLLEMMIKLASLQTSFVTMDEALKVTNRRV